MDTLIFFAAIVAALFILDVLALRFGTDSRIDPRDRNTGGRGIVA
ncbi:MAG: hypothetical protein RL338_1846 [Chloroflexota bacterium]|jgi:hypothetical protein